MKLSEQVLKYRNLSGISPFTASPQLKAYKPMVRVTLRVTSATASPAEGLHAFFMPVSVIARRNDEAIQKKQATKAWIASCLAMTKGNDEAIQPLSLHFDYAQCKHLRSE
jgi:hypothetical protein